MNTTHMKTCLVAAGLLMLASPAFAHHPLGGMPMTTFTHGILSGIGHPLLGFDHLFFVAAVGIAAIYTGRALLAPAVYLVGMLAGVGLTVAEVALPGFEAVIALSLLLLGSILMSGRTMNLAMASLVFVGFGLFHGWAFGATLVGQEGAANGQVVIGYLLGLSVIQWGVAITAGALISRLSNVESANNTSARFAGSAVAGVGLFLSLEAAEGLVLSLLKLAA